MWRRTILWGEEQYAVEMLLAAAAVVYYCKIVIHVHALGSCGESQDVPIHQFFSTVPKPDEI